MNKFYLVKIAIIFLTLLFPLKSIANENKEFLSLKNNKVNLRIGPSINHPIKLIYKKKHLTVSVIDKSETWRKIVDFENNSGWIHVSQLSRKKTAINIKKNSILYKKSTIFSKPIAILEIGRLVIIKKCSIDWCKITSADFTGWVFKNHLWGNTK
jgi:SH3-like domain-containing protein